MPYPFSYDNEAGGDVSPAVGRMREIFASRGTRGPFGGDVAVQGQGGFRALPEATVARTPAPSLPPAEGMGIELGGGGAMPSPYAPIRPRAENTPNRIATRRAATQMMIGAGRTPAQRAIGPRKPRGAVLGRR